ncbi:MAG: esterase-like activity of phytase family protein [Candidatus Solibacter usitatus]|nr:esterase-like activity of phytase family protein [Candidatus Solibacter usitatus]
MRTALVALALAASAFAQDGPARWKLTFLSDLNIRAGAPFDQVGKGAAAEVRRIEGDVFVRKASGAFGGISALACDGKNATLHALSDSTKPVMFSFKVSLEGERLALTPLHITPLAQADGSDIPTWTLDPEGLVLTRAASRPSSPPSSSSTCRAG